MILCKFNFYEEPFHSNWLHGVSERNIKHVPGSLKHSFNLVVPFFFYLIIFGCDFLFPEENIIWGDR